MQWFGSIRRAFAPRPKRGCSPSTRCTNNFSIFRSINFGEVLRGGYEPREQRAQARCSFFFSAVNYRTSQEETPAVSVSPETRPGGRRERLQKPQKHNKRTHREGHEFTRAAKPPKITSALAPEVRFEQRPLRPTPSRLPP